MEIIKGKRISKGIAIGKIVFYSNEKQPERVFRKKITDYDGEINRYEEAKILAKNQLDELYYNAIKEVGTNNASIFEVQKLIIDDPDFNQSVLNMIRNQNVNADYAVAVSGANFVNIFSNMEDEYFKSRAIDIKDVTERLISILTGNINSFALEEQCIFMSSEITPSQTVKIDKTKLLGFITMKGGSNSHCAILARSFGIPSITNISIKKEWNGKLAIIDGYKGLLIIEPDNLNLEKYTVIKEKDDNNKYFIYEMIGKKSVTKSGKEVKVYANAGSLKDINYAKKNDAEGIGLFRTEYLFMQAKKLPSEEEQFETYKSIVKACADKKVIFRTIDIGSDKKIDYIHLKKEANPALGFRGIRICLEKRDFFKTQLRALYRASIFGNIGIMFPMITSVDEIAEIRLLFAQVQKELEDSNVPFGNIEVGVMIETPAAALISDELAKEVDFFSIGTNDLTQFTLAVDRDNMRVDKYFNVYHNAVMKLIKMTIENAHNEGIWVGICGEIASDTELVKTFIDMGVDELSVAPNMVLQIRKAITECE